MPPTFSFVGGGGWGAPIRSRGWLLGVKGVGVLLFRVRVAAFVALRAQRSADRCCRVL